MGLRSFIKKHAPTKKRELIYIDNREGELVCSQCDQVVEMVVTIPLLGVLLDPQTWTKEEDAPWIGLCEKCVAELHAGFEKARTMTDREATKETP